MECQSQKEEKIKFQESIHDSKIKGPTLPPPSSDDLNVEEEEDIPKIKPKKRRPKKHTKHENDEDESKDSSIGGDAKVPGDYDISDPKYATWLPPANQSGDGRTSLNDKYGY